VFAAARAALPILADCRTLSRTVDEFFLRLLDCFWVFPSEQSFPFLLHRGCCPSPSLGKDATDERTMGYRKCGTRTAVLATFRILGTTRICEPEPGPHCSKNCRSKLRASILFCRLSITSIPNLATCSHWPRSQLPVFRAGFSNETPIPCRSLLAFRFWPVHFDTSRFPFYA
jgi:hypothetical protein